MNRNFFRLPIISGALLLAIVIIGGCRERTLINSRVSPANDTAAVSTQVLKCITHTYFDNNVYSSTDISGVAMNQAVGVFTDSFFGTMTASTFMQLAPENEPGAVFTATQVVDSAVLIVPYSGFTYGDTMDQTATQTYQAFYMADTLGYYTPYYPFSDKAIDLSSPLSDPVTFNVFHLKDSIYATDSNAAGLRIHLKLRNFLPRLNAALAAANTAANAGGVATTAFISAFNGICIRPADTRSTSKAIPYFRLDGTADFLQAGIMVYYHDTTDPTTPLIMSFNYDPAACAHFNNIVKNYRNYPVNKLIHSTAANDSIVAMQNQPGAGIDIKIYGINSIPANVVITKAQLQLTVLPGYNPTVYAGPERVYPVGIGNGTFPVGIEAGLSYLVEDQQPITSLTPYTILDGAVHSIIYSPTTTLQTYTIGLPREILACITAKNDTLHLHLNGSQDYLGAFHLVAGGGNYSDSLSRAKLIVVYSTLKR